MGLLDDLNEERERNGERDYGCSACRALAALDDDAEREALQAALLGTLSARALVRISKKNRLGIGLAGIKVHREEGHTL